MRVAVLGGGGAMGGLFGALLAEAGNEVALIDVSTPAVDSINTHGLTIEEKDGSRRRVHVRASSNPEGVGAVDLIVNFVKCYHTDAAIRSAAPMLGPDTAILTLQNGWGNAAKITSIVGQERVLVGLTYHSATLVTPGHVRHPGVGMTYVGELDGRVTPRLERVVETFNAAGLEATLSTSVLAEVWKKLALNVCTLPTAALMRFQAHELVEHEGMLATMRALLAEVVSVAQVQGIPLDFDERWDAITSLLRRAVGAKASMLQDVEARRRTEIDVINGAIAEAGRRHNIPTPYNDTMIWLVRSLEETFSQQAKAA